MRCGILSRNGAVLLVLLLWGYSCVSAAYSQEVRQEDAQLLDELERIIERQAQRIAQLGAELEKQEHLTEEQARIIANTEKALAEVESLLKRQGQILSEQEPLLERYERSARVSAIEAGLLGGFGGAVLGFVGGVLGMYYLGVR